LKEEINLKANKASVANALHRKANKLDQTNIQSEMKNKFEQIGTKLDKLLLDLNHFVEENKNEKVVNKEMFEK
jgi:hypothetical protein